MRARRVLTLLAIAAFAALPALAQTTDNKISLKVTEELHATTRTEGGRNIRYVSGKFYFRDADGKRTDKAPGKYKISAFEEDGGKMNLMKEIEFGGDVNKELSVILAVDISGSMVKGGRMKQAKEAAKVFFNLLPPEAKKGLILFDHQVPEPKDVKFPVSKEELIKQVEAAEPRGGTAYIDAAYAAIKVLEPIDSKKIVVVMTDGVDLNSKKSLDEVISLAKSKSVTVYTIGIGEPGTGRPVTTTLVLDKSASMLLPANEKEKQIKLADLQDAAQRYVRIIPDNQTHVRSAILEFSDTLKMPENFTSNKDALLRQIRALKAEGETAFIDATYAAILALEADKGNTSKTESRAVITLTDGVDNTSRRRPQEVIDRANKAGIPVYMLGFGRRHEIDEPIMKQIAESTKGKDSNGKDIEGKYYYAESSQKLLEIFENLSIQIHDDGIDEATLKTLAERTGGKYYAAKDVDKLPNVVEDVQKDFLSMPSSIEFASQDQTQSSRNIKTALKLHWWNPTSNQWDVLQETTTIVGSHSLVLSQLSPMVYLFFLAVIGFLAVLPAGLARLKTRTAAP